MLEGLVPERSAEDFVNGVIRVYLGTEEFLLAELTMNEMDAWARSVDDELAGLLRGVENTEDSEAIVRLLTQSRDRLIETLATYPGVPAPDWMREHATPSQVLRGLMGVWSAANPLVATFVEGLLVMQARNRLDGNVSALMSTLRAAGGGPSGNSGSGSRGASSSPLSTPSSKKPKRTTSTRSKQSASATSSPGSPADTTLGVPSIDDSADARRRQRTQPGISRLQ